MTTSQKTCFKCNAVKPLTCFYKHSQMADGRLNKCKECNKKDVRKNYAENVEQYQAYERKRAMLPHRVAARRTYVATNKGKEAVKRSCQKFRVNNPEKAKAHRMVNYRLRSGAIIAPKLCSVCLNASDNIHGHHEDYSKPLALVWCCPRCHSNIHKGVFRMGESMIKDCSA